MWKTARGVQTTVKKCLILKNDMMMFGVLEQLDQYWDVHLFDLIAYDNGPWFIVSYACVCIRCQGIDWTFKGTIGNVYYDYLSRECENENYKKVLSEDSTEII